MCGGRINKWKDANAGKSEIFCVHPVCNEIKSKCTLFEQLLYLENNHETEMFQEHIETRRVDREYGAFGIQNS